MIVLVLGPRVCRLGQAPDSIISSISLDIILAFDMDVYG